MSQPRPDRFMRTVFLSLLVVASACAKPSDNGFDNRRASAQVAHAKSALGEECGGKDQPPCPCETEQPCEWETIASETKLVFGREPGELLFDASDGMDLFPMPSEPRKFADWKSYQQFLVNDLNARVAVTEDRSLDIGGRIEMSGKPIWWDETGEYHEVLDPVATYIGGTFGYVIIGETTFCIDPEVCTNELVSGDKSIPPGTDMDALIKDGGIITVFKNGMRMMQAMAMGASGPFTKTCTNSVYCIKGESYITHALVYNSAGGTTTQVIGGSSNVKRKCGPFGWFTCTTKVWQDSLSVNVSYTAPNGYWGNKDQKAQSLVESVTASRWTVFASEFNQPDPQNIVKVYSQHQGSDYSNNTDYGASCTGTGC